MISQNTNGAVGIEPTAPIIHLSVSHCTNEALRCRMSPG